MLQFVPWPRSFIRIWSWGLRSQVNYLSKANYESSGLTFHRLIESECESTQHKTFYYIVECKMLKIHSKIFSISLLVKISIT